MSIEVDITSILRDAWRISWRAWQLWLLMLLLFVVFVPAMTLAGAFGGVAAMVSLPMPGRVFPLLAQLQRLPVWVWVLIAVAALVLLVVTMTVSWILQAAAMRGAAQMVERSSLSLRQALALGWPRVVSLLQLSLTFGTLIAAIGLLPPLFIILLARWSPFGLALMQLAQTALAPVSMVLGLALLLIMLSVALEDLRPRAAMRRARSVFRQGWWAFLLVLGASAAPGFVVGVLAVIPVMLIMPVLVFEPRLGAVLLLAGCGLAGLLGLVLLLFTAVFTIVLYTLIYRAAARQLGTQPAV